MNRRQSNGTFSISVPLFSLEDEAKERSALTEEERENIRRDLCGGHGGQHDVGSSGVVMKGGEEQDGGEAAGTTRTTATTTAHGKYSNGHSCNFIANGNNDNEHGDSIMGEADDVGRDEAEEDAEHDSNMMETSSYNDGSTPSSFSPSSSSPPHEPRLNELVSAMEEIVRRSPPEQKRAYLAASALCPHLIHAESPPSLFLMAEQYNPEAAAHRLLHYWTVREAIFGNELAFRPMSTTPQDGDSEAAHQARQSHAAVMATGFCQVLPPDKFGRGVLFYDRSLVPAEIYDRDAVVRVLWVQFHALIRSFPQAALNGIVVIADVRRYTLHGFDRKLFKKNVEQFVRGGLPASIRAVHICCMAHRSILEYVCPMAKFIAGKHLRNRFVLHHGDAKDLLMGLEEYGLDAMNLPASMGGSLCFHHGTQILPTPGSEPPSTSSPPSSVAALLSTPPSPPTQFSAFAITTTSMATTRATTAIPLQHPFHRRHTTGEASAEVCPKTAAAAVAAPRLTPSASAA